MAKIINAMPKKAKMIHVSVSAKITMDPWAKDMLQIIDSTYKGNSEIDSVDLNTDGTYIEAPEGKKLIKVFKTKGYKPHQQVTDYWVIPSKDNSSVGLTIDFREEELEDADNECCIAFFKEA
jgi:hypothetical protein